jgi:23S rRNA (pseudouridine1915-N3)-methyltransferase
MAKPGVKGVVVIWVGRPAARAVDELAADYLARISRTILCTDIRVRPAAGRGGDPGRALALEAEAIATHVRPGDLVVALDERGRERTTEEFSFWLGEALARGRTAFVIGSDLGLAPELKASARETLALSRLTLPHQLARVLLLEQVYRALDLAAGGSYHRPTEPSHV